MLPVFFCSFRFLSILVASPKKVGKRAPSWGTESCRSLSHRETGLPQRRFCMAVCCQRVSVQSPRIKIPSKWGERGTFPTAEIPPVSDFSPIAWVGLQKARKLIASPFGGPVTEAYELTQLHSGSACPCNLRWPPAKSTSFWCGFFL